MASRVLSFRSSAWAQLESSLVPGRDTGEVSHPWFAKPSPSDISCYGWETTILFFLRCRLPEVEIHLCRIIVSWRGQKKKDENRERNWLPQHKFPKWSKRLEKSSSRLTDAREFISSRFVVTIGMWCFLWRIPPLPRFGQCLIWPLFLFPVSTNTKGPMMGDTKRSSSKCRGKRRLWGGIRKPGPWFCLASRNVKCGWLMCAYGQGLCDGPSQSHHVMGQGFPPAGSENGSERRRD